MGPAVVDDAGILRHGGIDQPGERTAVGDGGGAGGGRNIPAVQWRLAVDPEIHLGMGMACTGGDCGVVAVGGVSSLSKRLG